MAVEEKKTRLQGMLAQRGTQPATPGKATAADQDNASDEEQAGGEQERTDEDQAHQEAEAKASTDQGEAPTAKPPSAPTAPTAARPETVGKKAEGGEGTGAPAAASGGAAPAGKKGNAGKITATGKSPKVGAPISKMAIGEQVVFSAQEEGMWKFDGEEIGRGQTLAWTAPTAATAKNLVFEPYLTSDNKNTQASLPLLIAEPSKVLFKKLGDVPNAGPNMAGVGMRLQVSIKGDDDIAFDDIEWLERPGPAEGVSGYFQAYGAGKLAHVPAAEGISMKKGNIIDSAWSRDKPKLTHPDGKGARWWAGSFSWTIPNVYRFKGVEKTFDTVVQTFTIAENGMMTVSKGGASASAKPESETDASEVSKFKTKGEAETYLRPHGLHGMLAAALNYKRSPKADPESVKFLGLALGGAGIQVKTNVTCRSTIAWVGSDVVSISANGNVANPASQKINSGETKSFTFPLGSVINLTTLDASMVALTGTMEKVAHYASLEYPYDGLSGSFTGSDKYSYTSNLAWA